MTGNGSDTNLVRPVRRNGVRRLRPHNGRGWRAGNTIIQVALVLPVILGILSLAVDLANVMCARSELQGAVDSAALAGSGGLLISPAEARLRAKTLALSNRVAGKPLTLLDSDIELGTWDETDRTFTVLDGAGESSANALRVKGVLSTSRANTVKLTFVPLISSNFSSFGMAKSAISVARRQSADVVVVQDVSGSFRHEIAYARSGDRDLLDSMNVTGTKSNFGLVAFTGTSATVTSIKSVASAYSTLKYAVDSLDVGSWNMPHTSTGTDIAAGIEEGLSLFDQFSSTNKNRCMVIVSDGEPSAHPHNAHPGLSDYQLLTLAQSRANAVYAEGIDVYVVFWDSADDPTAAANLRSLVRGKGAFVHVTDPTRISESVATVLARSQSLVR